jgi:hypothetical protein
MGVDEMYMDPYNYYDYEGGELCGFRGLGGRKVRRLCLCVVGWWKGGG